MSNFLAQALRRLATNNSRDSSPERDSHRPSSEPSSPMPPVITASTSSLDTVEQHQAYLRLTRAPCTPQGLLPRPSSGQLAQLLQLQHLRTSSPQREIRGPPSRSWSIPLSSPPISNNSFYEGSADEVATSPSLCVGNTKTAVGALVASFQREEEDYLPLMDDQSSVAASPSSLARPYPFVRTNPSTQDKINDSFASNAALLPAQQCQRYDWTAIADEGQEVVLSMMADHHTQVSGLSRAVSEDQDEIVDDSSLRIRKQVNQRKVKEGLILAIVERIQDDLELLKQVEEMEWPLTKTPVEQDGLLTGIPKSHREKVKQKIHLILNELDTAHPEEFILVSPTQIHQFAETHEDLRHALSFFHTLVHMALTPQEREHETGRWNMLPGLRDALGILPPESPPRGGDTSVFSLPSDSTPMTSNVSVATTITTAAAAEQARYHNGLAIRRTIQSVSSCLQHLSQVCQQVISVHATKEIKRVYTDLLAIGSQDLKAVVDAFELDAIIRTVSRDDDDQVHPILPPPNVLRPHPDWFSPTTLDMESTYEEFPNDPNEYDDLRRQMGSTEYGDDYEEREGAPKHPDCREVENMGPNYYQRKETNAV